MINDVVATQDDGFLITHMMPTGNCMLGQMVEFLKASLFGVESGYVLAWRLNEDFSLLAGSKRSLANGIEISPDGETIFLNYSLNGELRRISRRSGNKVCEILTIPSSDYLPGHAACDS